MDLFLEANKHMGERDYKTAIKKYQDFIKTDEGKDYSSAYYNIGVAYIGRYKKEREENHLVLAIDYIKLAIKYSIVDIAKYWHNLGYCYGLLDDKKKSLICFKTANCIDGSDEGTIKAINLLERYMAK